MVKQLWNTIKTALGNEDGIAALPLISLGLDLFRTLQAGQASSSASAQAGAAEAQRAAILKEYLQDIQAGRPIRQHLARQFALRASSPPGYASTWGQYWPSKTEPFPMDTLPKPGLPPGVAPMVPLFDPRFPPPEER